jgi:hypothetical protein
MLFCRLANELTETQLGALLCRLMAAQGDGVSPPPKAGHLRKYLLKRVSLQLGTDVGITGNGSELALGP